MTVRSAEVERVQAIADIPEDQRASRLIESGEVPYILIIDKGDDSEGDSHLTIDISDDYLTEDGRTRLVDILSAILKSLT